MKISYNWLKQYINHDLDPGKVADYLTGCGLEVENLEVFQSVKGGLKGVVIGEVLTCEKHPNSDHLTLTTVDIGQKDPLKIVCGASNVAVGQKVPVATIGTVLYVKDKEITLQRSKIRGEISEGMICAEDELGLGTSHTGIMILDPGARPGMAARDYFSITEDYIFTIGLTPNRTDAMSHIGVARDLVAVLNNFGRDSATEKKSFHLQIPDISSFSIKHHDRKIDITVEDPVACPRYSGLTFTGIMVKESPAWLQNKLLAIGLRPINNIVDITNYIQMELGQPLHAFDGDQITGDTVIVKKYPRGTRFVTLDGIERLLTENDLMICNTREPMCMAGVFGGIKSGITGKTKTLFLESAYFDPRHIRITARHHGLQTDASFRYERGSDVDITVYALKHAAQLIREIAGGFPSSEIIDIYPNPIENKIVSLDFNNLDRIVGKSIDREVVLSIITDLGMNILKATPKMISVKVPGFKSDVTRESDLIEEVLRIYGYNNVEILPEIRASLSYSTKPDSEKIQDTISGYLASMGFYEIMNNSLSKSSDYEGNKDFPARNSVKVLNPLSRDLDTMRQTLLYGGLETIVYNQNRKIQDLKIFEFGTVYSLGSGLSTDPLPGYHEEKHLALFLTGRVEPENWNSRDQQVGFFDLKGIVEAIFTKLGIYHPAFRDGNLTGETYSSGIISEGFRYSVNGKTVVIFGFLRDSILKTFECRHPVLYAEWDWDALLAILPKKEIQVTELNKFPEVRRDLALLLDRSVNFKQIEQIAYDIERKMIKKIDLFDVYEGPNIQPEKKSYAISFILQDEQKTLTDDVIEKTMERLIKAFSTKLNAQIR